MNTRTPSLWHRWLALTLIGLLALGPFLHSHFGASHDTGFHVDGLHEVHHASTTTDLSANTPDDESPALGVATSLPEDSHSPAWPLALWLVVLPLLPVPVRWVFTRLTHLPPRARPVYCAGMPPPCLAPPRP